MLPTISNDFLVAPFPCRACLCFCAHCLCSSSMLSRVVSVLLSSMVFRPLLRIFLSHWGLFLSCCFIRGCTDLYPCARRSCFAIHYCHISSRSLSKYCRGSMIYFMSTSIWFSSASAILDCMLPMRLFCLLERLLGKVIHQIQRLPERATCYS